MSKYPHCGQVMNPCIFKIKAGYYSNTETFLITEGSSLIEAENKVKKYAQENIHPKSIIISSERVEKVI